MAYDSRAVANYILEKAKERGFKLTPMHLLKLVYFAHGWSLALLDRPLIEDEIQAWNWGPVIPNLYHAIKKYGSGPITEEVKKFKLGQGEGGILEVNFDDLEKMYETVKGNFTEEEKQLLDRVIEVYGPLKAFQLSALTHEAGSPWAQTYQAGVRDKAIPDELIKESFRRQAEQNARAAAAQAPAAG